MIWNDIYNNNNNNKQHQETYKEKERGEEKQYNKTNY